MTLNEIDQKITSITNVDNTVYSAALRLIDINIWQHKIQTAILLSEDEVDFDDSNYADYPNLTTPLVAGQRDYTIPKSEKVISFKRVDISYDGQNSYRANPIDTGEIYTGLAPASGTAQNAKLDALYPRTAPRYDVSWNSVFAYPMPNASDIANGGYIFIEWDREIKEFTATDYTNGTATPGFDTAFHPLLAYGPSYEFLLGTGQDTSQVEDNIKETMGNLQLTYGKKQKDRTMSVVPIYNNFK